jgi:hypothetical protein
VELGTSARTFYDQTLDTRLKVGMVVTMPAVSIPRLRSWVERGLAENGHPALADIVREARHNDPQIGWAPLAADVSARSGEPVSYETLRQWFGDADPEPEGSGQ